MSRIRPAFVLLLLFALTLAPIPGFAAPKQTRPAAAISSEQPGLIASLFGLIRRVAEKTGCAVDPLGRCVPATSSQPEPICTNDDPLACQDWR